MSEALHENDVEIRERFEVDNDMKAEWCLNKIRKIRQEQSRETEELERQMRFYEEQMQIIAEKADKDVDFFEGMLRGYFNDREEAGFTKSTKTKESYKLPTGELVLKHREPEYEKDEPIVLDWLKKNGGNYIKVKESLDWSGLKKGLRFTDEGNAVDENGELVPGIKAVIREDEFVVEVK